MSQWQLHHFFDLCQLLTTTSNIVITDLIQSILFLLTSHTIPYTNGNSYYRLYYLANNTNCFNGKYDNELIIKYLI